MISLRRLSAIVITATVVATAVVLGRQTAPAPAVRVLRVTSTADDGSDGTLRWAIATSNASAERERIELDPADAAGRVITLRTPLPPIRGPVQIEGMPWNRSGDYVVIDGSGYVPPGGPQSCPGAVAGQYGANVRTTAFAGLQLIDTADVEIAGLEVRRFCIGILINRSMRVTIRDNRIAENRGGAGVMLTGDDGQGNPTATTTNDNKVLRNDFVDNGDGLELTRGAAYNLVADNVFRSTPANPEPSQGIEILRGNDNVVSGNQFSGYSDGLQINWGDRNYIAANTFTGNTFGLNLTGVGNVIDGNDITGNRIGIVVRPADPTPLVRLTRNRIVGNGQEIRRCEAGGSCDPAAPKGPIVFGLPGLEHAAFRGSRGGGVNPDVATLLHICPENAPRCQEGPNPGVTRPTLTRAAANGSSVDVSGEIRAVPASRYLVELFGNTDAGSGQSELFLGQQPVYTDSRGQATFTMRVDRGRAGRRVESMTATITSADGGTSPLSGALKITESSSR